MLQSVRWRQTDSPRPCARIERLFESQANALPAAVAVECLHTYTLIHDDLPAMDDSNLRRGVDTCHIRFDEATAILAGDALLTYAFELLAKSYSSEPSLAVELIMTLSETAGSQKLIGGQMEDMIGENHSISETELEYIHLNKTSALIEASLNMGAAIGGANDDERNSISEYCRCIGLGFQIMDDILDTTSDSRLWAKQWERMRRRIKRPTSLFTVSRNPSLD